MQEIRDYWKKYADENWAIPGSASEQTGNSYDSEALFFVRMDEIRRNLYLDSSAVVLDLGGGVGWVAWCLAPYVAKWIVVDHSGKSIEMARGICGGIPNVEMVEADMVDYKINCKPSRILLAGALLYLGSVEAAMGVIKGIYDSVNYGSIVLIMQLPNLQFRDSGAIKSIDLISKLIWFDPFTLAKSCSDIGFRLIDVFQPDGRHTHSRQMFSLWRYVDAGESGSSPFMLSHLWR